MEVQPSIALSHGLAVEGQQSCIGSEADISVAAWSVAAWSVATWTLNAAPLAAGSKATAAATKTANMVRARTMVERSRISGRRRSPVK